MLTMTAAQIGRLHTAVDRSKNFGEYCYVRDNRPCCVIAQLSMLEGATIKELAAWEHDPIATVITDNKTAMLGDYPIELLTKLQDFWDHKLWPDKPGLAKEAMRRAINRYVSRSSKR